MTDQETETGQVSDVEKSVDNVEKNADPSESIEKVAQERVEADTDTALRTEASREQPGSVVDHDDDEAVDNTYRHESHGLTLLDRLSGMEEDFWARPWGKVNKLNAPEPLPGKVQRWVRVKVRNDDDAANLQRQIQIGWIPRPAETVPKHYLPPTMEHGDFKGCIIVEGSVLCHMPAERAAQRRAWVANEALAKDQSVMQRAGRYGIGREKEAQTEVQTGGNRPVVAPNE